MLGYWCSRVSIMFSSTVPLSKKAMESCVRGPITVNDTWAISVSCHHLSCTSVECTRGLKQEHAGDAIHMPLVWSSSAHRQIGGCNVAKTRDNVVVKTGKKMVAGGRVAKHTSMKDNVPSFLLMELKGDYQQKKIRQIFKYTYVYIHIQYVCTYCNFRCIKDAFTSSRIRTTLVRKTENKHTV